MGATWRPPEEMGRDEIISLSEKVLSTPDLEYSETEILYRVVAADLEWDIGVTVYEPTDSLGQVQGRSQCWRVPDPWWRQRLALDGTSGTVARRQVRLQGSSA